MKANGIKSICKVYKKNKWTQNKNLKSFLDRQNIPYWYINQGIDTFSPALKKLQVQRPDFFILIPNFGFILIDVEHNIPLEKHEKFCISCLYQKLLNSKSNILQKISIISPHL